MASQSRKVVCACRVTLDQEEAREEEEGEKEEEKKQKPSRVEAGRSYIRQSSSLLYSIAWSVTVE